MIPSGWDFLTFHPSGTKSWNVNSTLLIKLFRTLTTSFLPNSLRPGAITNKNKAVFCRITRKILHRTFASSFQVPRMMVSSPPAGSISPSTTPNGRTLSLSLGRSPWHGPAPSQTPARSSSTLVTKNSQPVNTPWRQDSPFSDSPSSHAPSTSPRRNIPDSFPRRSSP